MRPNHRTVILLALVLVSHAIVPPARANEPARARGGMVVTVHPVATDAAVRVMEQGGNAVDAAVAAALMLGVVDGHNSGIGGGCFMLIRSANGETVALDGREVAPAAATRDMFVRDGKADTSLSQTGALASGVPGSLMVYDHAINQFGNKKLADVIAPAARVAEDGFPIDANYAKRLRDTLDDLRRFEAARQVLLKPDGSPLAEGERLRQPDLAGSYRAIGEQGVGWFYGGEFARLTEQWMTANGGVLTAKDFADYRMKTRTPLVSTYGEYTIVSFPPPSSGGVHVAQILNILEHFDLKRLEQQDPAGRIHVVAEAMKLAFADRAYWLGDPEFAKVPAGLIEQPYADELAKRIDPQRATKVERQGTPPDADQRFFGSGDKHTTHIAAADAQGNWVAITTTVNTAFGSKVIIPGTGVILNNQMDDFAIDPGTPNAFGLVGADANAVAPGKRPLSSMSPTIVLRDDRPVLTIGAAGGPRIITQVVNVLVNHLALDQDLPTAMRSPRFHHQWSPDKLWIENATDAAVLERLRGMGHELDIVTPVGATQAIRRDDGMFVGAPEPRLRGKAAGPAERP